MVRAVGFSGQGLDRVESVKLGALGFNFNP